MLPAAWVIQVFENLGSHDEVIGARPDLLIRYEIWIVRSHCTPRVLQHSSKRRPRTAPEVEPVRSSRCRSQDHVREGGKEPQIAGIMDVVAVQPVTRELIGRGESRVTRKINQGAVATLQILATGGAEPLRSGCALAERSAFSQFVAYRHTATSR